MAIAESRMEAPLWRRLPLELVERVLSFLPVPDLCRSRAVCKIWDALITTEKFRILSLENGTTNDASFALVRVVEECETLGEYGLERQSSLSWSILDLEARPLRWYRIQPHHPQAEILEVALPLISSGIVVTSGGLVCEAVYLRDVNAPYAFSVYNPVFGKVRDVPEPPWHLTADCDPLLEFVVDDSDDSFQIFYVNQGLERIVNPNAPGDREEILRRPVMHIYDSITDQWRSAVNPPVPPELGVGDIGSTVVLHRLLYVLFSSYDNLRFWLFAYSILEDVWEDTNMHNELGMHDPSELIVSGDRLFLLSRSPRSFDFLSVSEIFLEEKVIRKVCQMSIETFRFAFMEEIEVVRRWNPDYNDTIQAFGIDGSLVFRCVRTGVTIMYNLATESWNRLPKDPLKPQMIPGHACQLWYGKVMNLCLPSRRSSEGGRTSFEEGSGSSDEGSRRCPLLQLA